MRAPLTSSDGATRAKMDNGVKFLGWYHPGQMHSGILIIAGKAGAGGFTHTATFLGGDFHRITPVYGRLTCALKMEV